MKAAMAKCFEPTLDSRKVHPGQSQVHSEEHRSLPTDGFLGVLSVMALQRLLVRDGHPCGPVDGRCGRRTIRALQMFLVHRGYKAGPIDGWCGRKSTMALQMWVRDQGASPGPIDGRWGRRTTHALQRVLNTLQTAPSVVATEGAPSVATTAVVAHAPSTALGEFLPVPIGRRVDNHDASQADPDGVMGTPVVVTGLPVTSTRAE